MPPDEPPPPERLLAIAQAARIMGIHRDAASRLIAAGALPAFVDGAGRTLTTAKQVEDLAAASPLVVPRTERPAFVVRPESATPTAGWQADARRWAGWAKWLNAEDRHRGVDRWWAVREPATWVGRPFLVAIGGVIVEAGRIAGHHEDPAGVRWSVDWADPQCSGHVGTRMPTIRGGPWIAWPTAAPMPVAGARDAPMAD